MTNHPRRLRYDQPATHFNEALPVGNGRLGAMFYGGVATERLHLNEDSLWSGSGPAAVPPEGLEALPEIRRLLFAGELRKAHELAIRTLPGPFTEAYQPAGDLVLESLRPPGAVSGYRRELDLEQAVGSVTFVEDGVRHVREVFASHPAGVVVLRWTVDRPGALSCRIRLESPQRHRVAVGESALTLSGQAPSRVEWFQTKPGEGIFHDERSGRSGMTFVTGLAVVAPGARISCEGTGLRVEGATGISIFSDTRTSFASDDPAGDVASALDSARAIGWDALRADHVADHRALFDRVRLELGHLDEVLEDLTIPERLSRRSPAGPDPGLAALLFDYGRYLLIASSRPGSQPANLQGIWNRDVQPPWWSNYTLNINTQMNYWPAEVCGLGELHEPLFDFIDRLRRTGEVAAHSLYGCRGWLAHHQTDLWASATPTGLTPGAPNEGASRYAIWPMGGAWLTRHLWEHYLYHGDQVFLRERAWPAMKGAADFLLDFLVESPGGHLTTAPSTSPENSFHAEGFRAAIATGSAMDLAIIRDLLANCLAAERALGGREPEFVQRVQNVLERLPQPAITASGRLQEWDKDYPEWEPRHRHVSHLYGLHPAAEIDPARAPRLASAARRSLEARGDDGTGWSLAWKINFWARLLDGDHVGRLVGKFLFPVPPDKVGLDHPGGLYPNLLCAHPPFQIDGNFGFTAGIAEMLLQSHAGEIVLLPALPADWPSGRVAGLRARGGFIVDISWHNGSLVSAVLHSLCGNPCRLRYGEDVCNLHPAKNETREWWPQRGATPADPLPALPEP